MRQQLWSVLILHSPALIVPVNRFPNELPPNIPNNILRNPSFCSFTLFLIVLLTPFMNKPDSPRDLISFVISLVCLIEIINVALHKD